MSTEQEIAIDMAVRDLQSATLSLMELPVDLVRVEYDEIDAVHRQLTMVLIKMRRKVPA